ncbi:MAG: hypothetical protein ACW98Y_18680 [Candidatus Thorarchaeota archaeon]|jgi:hypothetical protein
MQLEIDLQSISIMIAATSVVIGVMMSVLSLRNISRSRQASVFLDFHRQANLEFIEHMSEIVMQWSWKDAEDFASKYGPRANPKAYSKFIFVASFFDSMGKLIEANVTNATLVPETLAVFAMAWCEKLESIESDIAAQWRSSGSMDSTDILYSKLKELGYRSPVRP